MSNLLNKKKYSYVISIKRKKKSLRQRVIKLPVSLLIHYCVTIYNINVSTKQDVKLFGWII